MSIIIDENGISKHCQQIIDIEIMSNKFPWFYQPFSTSNKFPFFSHTIIPRSEETNEEFVINSKIYYFFKDILDSFCMLHGIKIKRMLRGSLNLSLPNTKFPFTDPHCDHNIPHKVVIMYLNDSGPGGETVIFEEKFDGNVVNHLVETVNESFKVKEEIIPQKGKIVMFDGMHYHANRFCQDPNRRIICIFTIEVEE